MRVRPVLCLALLLTAATSVVDAATFRVTFPESAFAGQFNGRVTVFLSEKMREPRRGPDWFAPEPIFTAFVKNVRPGETMTIDDGNALGFPGKPSEVKAGEYYVQAVVDRDLGGRAIGTSPGNLYSVSAKMRVEPGAVLELTADQVVPEPKLTETERGKRVEIVSRKLSNFHGRPVRVRAAVLLPEAYATEPERKFPAIYEVSGFGGTDNGPSIRIGGRDTLKDGVPFVKVRLDASWSTGHTVFADSDNNGPWGAMLTEELIPEIERRFRLIAAPTARFVTGHSSGGWSSLWLQVRYPDFFGGVWSTAPDPIDFRDFQRMNLYASGENAYVEKGGAARPLARIGDRPVIDYRQFLAMEVPLRGEQMGSFEAVFSPRGADGSPRKIWDRKTGAVDPETAKAWRRYDIGLILRENWKELGPKLKGKLFIYMGDKDTFYLEGAVRLVQADLKRLGSDAVVEILPGDHGSLMTRELLDRIDRQMAAQFRRLNPR